MSKPLLQWQLGLIALLTLTSASDRADAARAKVVRVRLGNAADATPLLLGPSYLWQGNGMPGMLAFEAHVGQVATDPLDVVVLAASFSTSGSDTPECDEIIQLAGVSSCETVTIPLASLANDPGATQALDRAEIVYFAGGDQCNYVGWKGSSVHRAVKAVVARGGGVGGGSAGLAIQGEHVYDACTGSVSSSEALANPFHRAISFTHDLFLWPNHDRIITDTHFTQRDRMGRLMAFVARHLQEGRASAIFGVGVDEGTAVVIDKLGQGRVFGAGSVSVVVGDHLPELCAPKKRLTFSGFKIWKLVAGDSYDFAQRPASGFALTDVVAGVITPH